MAQLRLYHCHPNDRFGHRPGGRGGGRIFKARLAVVGSGTGAVIRRRLLGRVRGFPLRARVGVAVILCVSNCQFSRRFQDWATLRGARPLTDADSRMKNLLTTLLHFAVVTAKLCGPGGVRAVIAENLLLKQQLTVLRRGRQRAPNLALSDRLMCGLASLFLSTGRIRKVAIGLRPSTLLAFHQALVHRKYRRLFSSSQCRRTT